MTTYTYEFTAYSESDLLAGTGDASIGIGDTFSISSGADTTMIVTDDDAYLSGDSVSNENANDTTGQTAVILDASGAEVGNGGQVYAEQYFWVSDQFGNWYVMIDIEQEGDGGSYFTFFTGSGYTVPPANAILTIDSSCNVTSDWINYGCVDGGDITPPNGWIAGRLTFDADGNDNEFNDETGTWDLGVEDQTVQLLDAAGNVVAETTTDAYGNYSFDVSAGEYRVKFPALDGYEFSEKDSGVADHYDSDADQNGLTDLITVGEGQSVQDVDAGLKAASGTVSGTVFADADGDGLQDQGSVALGSNLLINSDFETNALNNSGGNVGVLTAGWQDIGSNSVAIHEQDYGLANATGDAVAKLYANTVLRQDVSLSEGGDYQLSFDVMRNYRTGDADNAFALYIDGEYHSTYAVTTNTRIDVALDLASGSHSIEFRGLGSSYHGAGIDDVSLQQVIADGAEDGVAGVTVHLLDANGDAVLDGNGQAITTVTDADGDYSFEGVDIGDYRVSFDAPAGQGFTAQDVGSNDNIDSDVDAGGVSSVVTVSGGDVADVDAGLIEDPLELIANDDVYTVLETEGAGDVEGNVLANDTSDFGAIDAVLRVNGQEANVGEWIDLDGGGRVRLMENGDLDFDADGDFENLAEGEVAMQNLTYTIAQMGEGSNDEYQCLFFGGHSAGTIIDDEYEANGVTISSLNGANPVMIFDTANPTGGDFDLASSTRGNVLILSEDGNSANPDDNAGGGTFVFDFHREADVESLIFLDTEEPAPEIRLYNEAGDLITTIMGPVTTDGGEGSADINVAGVYRMEVEIQGSGAIDNLIYTLKGEQAIDAEDTANVKINIIGVNDLEDGDEIAAVSESSGLTVVENALNNAVDPDGGAPVIETLEGVALNGGSATAAGNAGGTFTFNADGTVSFDTDGAFAYLSEGQQVVSTVTYEVSDGQGGLVTSSYSVTVTGTEGEPIIDAQDDMYCVYEDETFGDSEGNVLDNDDLPFAGENLVVEVNGQTGAVGQWIDLAGGGRVKLNADGELDFDANGAYDSLAAGQSAFETLNYTVRSSDSQQDAVVAVFEGPNGLSATAEIIEVNGELVVTLTVQTEGGDIGDIRGFFFDVSDESLLGGMSAEGADITDQEFDANSVFNLGGGNNVNGDIIIELGKFDGGVTAGTQGIGSDDIRSTTFTLSHASQNLALDLLLNQDMALRLTSVGDEGGSRGDSLKLGSVGLPSSSDSLVDTATVQVEIKGLNELADGDETAEVDEGSGATVLAVNALTNTVDIDEGSVPVVTPIVNADGSDGGTFSIDANGQITFDTNGDFSFLAEGETATTSVTYTVTDGQGGEVQSSVTITVNGVNSLEDGDETAEVDEGSGVTVLTVNALDNADDPDGGTPVVTPIVDQPGDNGGTFSIDENGVITFDTNDDFNTLGEGETATTTITYTVTDGQGGEVQSSITVTVNGVNDLEDAGETASVFEDAAPTQLDNALLNTVDPDSDPANIVIATLAGVALVAGTATADGVNGGSFTFLEDGTVTFSTDGDFDFLAPGEVTTTSISYQVTDGDGGLVTSTYSVEVTGVNDAPVAVANSYSTNEGEALTGANIITDPDQGSDIGEVDSDPNGDALVINSALGKDVNGDMTVDIVSSTFVTVYTDGGVAVEVKLDDAGNLEVSENSEVDAAGDQISLAYTVEDVPAAGEVKVSNEATVTVSIADVPDPAGPEINVVFLLDASRSAVLGQSDFGDGGSDFENSDVNGDGQIGSHFDGSLTLMQSMINAFTTELGANGTDVEIGVFAFEGDNPEGTNALNDNGTTVFGLDTDYGSIINNYPVGAKFGSNEVPLEENGNAFYAPAIKAANTFFTVNAENSDAINLVYVLTDSVGTDALPTGPDSLGDLFNEMTSIYNSENRPLVDTIFYDDGSTSTINTALSTLENFRTGPTVPSIGDGLINLVTDQASVDTFLLDAATPLGDLVNGALGLTEELI